MDLGNLLVSQCVELLHIRGRAREAEPKAKIYFGMAGLMQSGRQAGLGRQVVMTRVRGWLSVDIAASGMASEILSKL